MKLDFGFLFPKKQQSLAGLDISASAIRLVEISRSDKNKLTLEHCVSEALPRGAIVDGNIEEIEQISDAVSRLWRKAGVSAKSVVLGMPSASVITRKLILPADLTEDDMELHVESEISQYIPFALDEVSLDFNVIGPAKTDSDQAEVDVMVAAARREKVEERVAVVEGAGLTPAVMDVELHATRAALMRMMAQSEMGETPQIIALFEMGAQTTKFMVMVDGDVVYEREQAFGGNQLTQDISRAFGFSFDEAEQRKKSGELPLDYQAEVLEPFLESVIQEITRAIQFFYTSSPYTRVDHIVLAGGSAILPGMLDMIEEHTNVSTTLAQPFLGMTVSPNINQKQLAQDASAYLLACGLAMRNFDNA